VPWLLKRGVMSGWENYSRNAWPLMMMKLNKSSRKRKTPLSMRA
jgi:hypothetical protein